MSYLSYQGLEVGILGSQGDELGPFYSFIL